MNLAYNDEEMAFIIAAAAQAGLKPAAYAARAALAVAKGEVTPLPVDVHEQLQALGEARVQVRRIGVNLNQIAKALNAGEREAPELAAVLSRVEAAVRRVDRAAAVIVARRS